MSQDGLTCTLNAPSVVEALDYVTRLYDAVGGVELTDSFAASFQTGQLDPFLLGKVAMKIDGNWALNNIGVYAPDLNFGVVPAPASAGNESITWSGGFSWAMPRGGKNVELAWRFIKWMSSAECWMMANTEQYRYARSRGRPYVPSMTANRRVNEMIFEAFAPSHPRLRGCLRTFMDLMEHSRFRPVTPVGQILWDEHALAMDLAIHHKVSAQEALDRGTQTVQKQLNKIHQPEPPLLDTRVPLGVVGVILALGLVLFVRGYVRFSRNCRTVDSRQENAFGYLFASPWIIGFLLFTGGPFIASIVLSLCEYDSLHPVQWVGLQNYRELFKVTVDRAGEPLWRLWSWQWEAQDPKFWKSLWNTAFMILGVPLNMALGLGVAMLLNAKVKGMQFYRTLYYLPAIVPFVASSILWIWVLNPQHGLVNNLLRKVLDPLNAEVLLPFFKTSLSAPLWLQDENWSKPSIMLMGLWGAGAGMIVWLAGLKGIPEQLYESASIDGATWWGKFLHVTIPMLTPYIFFNLIMGMIGTLQIFAQAYIMTGGGPVHSTLFYVYYLFNNAFSYFKMGYACAMAWILFAIILVLTLVQWKLAPRWVHYD